MCLSLFVGGMLCKSDKPSIIIVIIIIVIDYCLFYVAGMLLHPMWRGVGQGLKGLPPGDETI